MVMALLAAMLVTLGFMFWVMASVDDTDSTRNGAPGTDQMRHFNYSQEHPSGTEQPDLDTTDLKEYQ